MALLARNVAQNCVVGRLSAGLSSGLLDDLSQEPTMPTTRKNDLRHPTAGAAPKVLRSPPAVQSLRWGDGAQLTEALERFQGFGPDVVLA